MSESLSCVRFNSSIAKVGVFNKTAIPYLHIEGFMLGYAEGCVYARHEIAGKMLAARMPVGKIAKYTDLSIEEIEALKA